MVSIAGAGHTKGVPNDWSFKNVPNDWLLGCGCDFHPVWRSGRLDVRHAYPQTWDNGAVGFTDKGCAYDRPRCQDLSAAPPIRAIRFRLRTRRACVVAAA